MPQLTCSIFTVLAIAAIFSTARAGFDPATQLITPDKVPPTATYNFDPEHRCALLDHQSVILKNADHHLLVIDGGFGIFQIDPETFVQDLNHWTVAFDLSKDFGTSRSELLWQVPKSRGKEPIVGRGTIWTDDTQNNIYIQGGHFFDGSNSNKSAWHLNKTDYPDYSIWKFDTRSQKWEDITNAVAAAEDGLLRTYAGAGVSVPATNRSFYIGGITDQYTSKSSPSGSFSSVSQMLEFDAGDSRIKKGAYNFSSNPGNLGYWQGTLEYLPIGCDNPPSGFLLALMSQSLPLDKTGSNTSPDQDDEEGDPVPVDSVWLYDIKGEKWYEQETQWNNDARPPLRTDYCSSIAYDNETKTWDLWIHGGQGVGKNKSRGFNDVWVLSMPTFHWKSLETAGNGAGINQFWGHTCHSVGGQLLIVGGNGGGLGGCDPDYINILDITKDYPDWLGAFSTNSTYASPPSVRTGNKNYKILEPFADSGWGDLAIRDAFNCVLNRTQVPKPNSTSNSSTSTELPTNVPSDNRLSRAAIGGIAAGATAGAVILLALIAVFCCFVDSRRKPPRHGKMSGILFKVKRPTPISETAVIEAVPIVPDEKGSFDTSNKQGVEILSSGKSAVTPASPPEPESVPGSELTPPQKPELEIENQEAQPHRYPQKPVIGEGGVRLYKGL